MSEIKFKLTVKIILVLIVILLFLNLFTFKEIEVDRLHTISNNIIPGISIESQEINFPTDKIKIDINKCICNKETNVDLLRGNTLYGFHATCVCRVNYRTKILALK